MVGIGVFGAAMFVRRHRDEVRYVEAVKRVEADCRAYRSNPLHRQAEV